jgi:hypothetical protein
MPGRSNACSELTRFWLEARHGCLVTESVPVKVPFGHSDIDLIAVHPRGERIKLPDGTVAGSRLIVETKDEHDFDPTGAEFGKLLAKDMLHVDTERGFIPAGAKEIKFSMLREQHHAKAIDFLGTQEFERLFVVHAIDQRVLGAHADLFARHRIHWLTVPELVRDLIVWCRTHQNATTLRNSLLGDLLHLLIGYCGLK